MKNSPFFSVVIPVYNKGPHIHRSISSVLNQTFQDFELILVNDASTDNSQEEIEKFKDKRISLYHREEPGPGGYAARNRGIEKAKGEWIAFLDADDEWYPNHLEKMHELAQKYPEVYFISCGWETQNNGMKKENEFYKTFKENETLNISVEEYLKAGIKRKLPVWTSVACVRKISPVAANLFPADLGAKRGGDLHAWLKLNCHHKRMAWSNHIGAIYYLDSINMVTGNADFSTTLMGKEIYVTLSENLKKREKELLKRYLNLRLLSTLIGRKSRKQNYTDVLKTFYWKNNYYFAFRVLIISLMPIHFLYSIKTKSK